MFVSVLRLGKKCWPRDDFRSNIILYFKNINSHINTHVSFKNMNQIAKHINTMAIDDFKDFDPNEINALLLSIDCSLNDIRGMYDR